MRFLVQLVLSILAILLAVTIAMRGLGAVEWMIAGNEQKENQEALIAALASGLLASVICALIVISGRRN